MPVYSAQVSAVRCIKPCCCPTVTYPEQKWRFLMQLSHCPPEMWWSKKDKVAKVLVKSSEMWVFKNVFKKNKYAI